MANRKSRILKSKMPKADFAREFGLAFLALEDQSDPVTNAAALKALDTTDVLAGSIKLVQSFGDFFRFDPNSTEADNGASILRPSVGPASTGNGRWIRMLLPDFKWMKQATWEIDPVDGDDEASGAPGFPIKTVAEFNRRLRWCDKGTYYNVAILNDLPATDVLQYEGDVWPGSGKEGREVNASAPAVNFKGQTTLVYSGMVSAATAAASSDVDGGEANTITDAGANWAAYTAGNHIIKFTSGTHNGYWGIPCKDLTGGVARLGCYSRSDHSGTATSGDLSTAPGAGDTYEVHSMTTVANVRASREGQVLVYYRDFNFTQSAVASIFATGRNLFYRCVFHKTVAFSSQSAGGQSSLIQALICRFVASVSSTTSSLNLNNCVTHASCTTSTGGSSIMQLNRHVAQGGQIFANTRGGLRVIGGAQALGIFDVTGDALQAWDSSSIEFVGGTATLYGKGSTGWGLNIQPGAQVRFPTNGVGTIRGTTGQLTLGGKTQLIPQPAGGAAQDCNTWAQWNASPFSRFACDFTGAWLHGAVATAG